MKEVNKIGYTTSNEVADKYEKILVEFAKNSLKVCRNTKTDQNGKSKWMNKECFKEQKAFKFAKNEFTGDPRNIDRRQRYLNQKKKYKKLLYLTKKSVVEKNMRLIGELASKSPNVFWRNVKHLMNNTKSTKQDYISPKGWVSYFRKLLNISKSTHTEGTSGIRKGPLDFLFSVDEIVEQIKNLKTSKSASASIANEMLKCNPTTVAKSLVKMFNFVLAERVYPKI